MRPFNKLYQTFNAKVTSRLKASGHKLLAQALLVDHVKVYKKPKWRETYWNSKAELPQECVKQALRVRRKERKRHMRHSKDEASKRLNLPVPSAHKAHKQERKRQLQRLNLGFQPSN
jgi:chemotaxis response regulator CheB